METGFHDVVLSSSGSICSSPSQVLPSALVLSTSDGGDGGHEAAAVCCGGFTGNAPAAGASESSGDPSSAATSSLTASGKLALDRTTASVFSDGQSVSSTRHIALSLTSDISSPTSELPLHGRSANDRLRTSETSQTTTVQSITVVSVIWSPLHHVMMLSNRKIERRFLKRL